MNRFLQNEYFDSNGLDLTLRLGLPESYNNDDRAAAAARQQRYNGFLYVGPFTNKPIVNLEIPDNVGDLNLPPVDDSLPQVFGRRIGTPTVCYGPISPGGEPELYWGYMTQSFVTIHLPEPTNTEDRQHFRTARTRTYASHPDQRCNNLDCNLMVTSMWRKGPFGPKTLCNSCGIEFRKLRDSIAAFVARRMAEITAGTKIQMPDNL